MFFFGLHHLFQLLLAADAEFVPLDIDQAFVGFGDFLMKISDSFEYVLKFTSFELLRLFDTGEDRGDSFSWLFLPLVKNFKQILCVCHNDELFIYISAKYCFDISISSNCTLN